MGKPVFTMKAYGFRHGCGIHENGSRHQAELVDIDQAGARLFFPEGNGRVRPFQRVFFHAGVACLGRTGIPSVVNGVRGPNVWIRFEQSLDTPLADIQREIGTA